MKPLISYYGGKQRMAHNIVPLLPRHTVYVEPFCGGAAIMFAKPWPPVTNSVQYRECLNDIDGRLVNLYRVVQQPATFEQFQRLVTLPYSRAVYNDAIKGTRKTIEGIDVQAAADYFISIQTSFANSLIGGWKVGVFSENHAYVFLKKLKRLPMFLERLSSAYIESRDAIDIIKQWDSPQTLFYCDPPYPGAQQGHYSGYTTEDFNRLVAAIDSANGSFVLSNYDQPGVPDHWERFEFKVATKSNAIGKERDTTKKTNTHCDSKRTEVVWRVDRSDNARPEIHDIWEQWARAGFQWGGDKRSYCGQRSLF